VLVVEVVVIDRRSDADGCSRGGDGGFYGRPIPHTTPQPFHGPFSRLTLVSECQKRTSGLYGARED